MSNGICWMTRTLFIAVINYFVFGGISTCLRVTNDLILKSLWVFMNSCPLNLLLVRCHRAEIIIKRLSHGRDNMTRVLVEPDHAIKVVEKTTPSPFHPCCRPGCRTVSNNGSGSGLAPAQNIFAVQVRFGFT